jgi:hypothetical protein
MALEMFIRPTSSSFGSPLPPRKALFPIRPGIKLISINFIQSEGRR